MTAQLRRQIAVLLIGVVAMLIALSVATWLRQDACLDAGGRWLPGSRTCELAAGATAAGSTGRAYVFGAVAGVLTSVVLWRTFTFFAARTARRSA